MTMNTPYGLFDLLDIASDKRDYLWRHRFMCAAPLARYQFITAIRDPEGHDYSLVRPLEGRREAMQGDLTFQQVVDVAYKNGIGLAFDRTGKDLAPEITLRFGAVWSYKHFDHLGGMPQTVSQFENALTINPVDPYAAFVSDDRTAYQGEPSEAFLPPAIRLEISQIIERFLPARPYTLYLYEEVRLALPMTLRIRFDEPIEDAALRQSLTNALLWVMPPYLPLLVC